MRLRSSGEGKRANKRRRSAGLQRGMLSGYWSASLTTRGFT
jgi:hypothetical protein